MTKENIRKIILQVLHENTGVEEETITDISHLKNDLGINSADLVEIQVSIEAILEIHLLDQDLEQVVTVNDLINLVEREVNNK